MKNILIIHESMVGGGAEKVLADILSVFDYTKFNVTILLEKANGVHLNKIPKRVEKLSVFDKCDLFYRSIYHFKPIRDAYLRYKLNSLLKERHFDTIVSFMEGPAIYLHQFLTDRANRNVTWVHTNFKINHWTKYLFNNLAQEADIYRKMDSVVFVSQGAADVFKKYFNFNGDYHIVYNFIPINDIIEKSQIQTIEKQRFTICNIGRLTKPKRQDRLIEVMAELKHRGVDCEAWILGTGDLEKSLKAHAKALNVDDMVKFLGFKPNPYPYLRAADMFLLTSDTEGFPLVVCEAMCLAKPIVSTNITGPDELLANGVGVLTPFDVQSIADAVQNLINDSDLRNNYATKAKSAAVTRFDTDAVMQQIYSLL